MTYTVRYFASLADQAGRASEEWPSAADDARALYQELAQRYAFTLPAARLRIAVNGEFAAWDSLLKDGDEIVFLPPVSGG